MKNEQTPKEKNRKETEQCAHVYFKLHNYLVTGI